MAKKAGTERKKNIEDLKVKDVETAEAKAVTGGKVAVHDIPITKFVDKSTPLTS